MHVKEDMCSIISKQEAVMFIAFNMFIEVPVWLIQCMGRNGFIVPVTNTSRDVDLRLNDNINLNISHVHCSSDGNWIAVVIEICHYSITLVVLYVPNTDTPVSFNQVQSIIEVFHTSHSIVVGD